LLIRIIRCRWPATTRTRTGVRVAAPIGESVIFEEQQEERLLEAERRAQEAERQRVEAEQVVKQSQRNKETGVLLGGRFVAARSG
jgi:hypothetical protein